jgi:beta-glucanase (GH16 family)
VQTIGYGVRLDEGIDRVIRYSRGRILRRVLLPPAFVMTLAGCGIAGAIGQTSPKPSSSVLNLPLDSQSPTSSATSTAPTGGSGWELAWQDDFTSSDLSKNWTFANSGSSFDDALNWFGEDSATVADGGGLVITAAKGGSEHACWYGPCKYTSTEMTSNFSQEYGRFEARIKIPGGAGLWPAFWLIPQPQPGESIPGEIDIVEVNNKNPDEVTGYVHDGPVYNYKAEKVLSGPISSQFHIYGVDWTPTGVTWTLDGTPYAHINKFPGWPLDQPFVIVFDLAVGGNWAGPPTASTVFPATMQVSWVRVYKMASLSLS